MHLTNQSNERIPICINATKFDAILYIYMNELADDQHNTESEIRRFRLIYSTLKNTCTEYDVNGLLYIMDRFHYFIFISGTRILGYDFKVVHKI